MKTSMQWLTLPLSRNHDNKRDFRGPSKRGRNNGQGLCSNDDPTYLLHSFFPFHSDSFLHQPSSVSSTLPSTRPSRCFNSTAVKMSDMKASVTETKKGFHVEGYEKIEYDFSFIDGVFDKQKGDLAECFSRWRRCLAVMDMNIYNVYGKQMQEYFEHHGLELKIHTTMIGEKAKSIDTFLSIVDSMTEFGMSHKQH